MTVIEAADLLRQATQARSDRDASALIHIGDMLERAGIFPEAWTCFVEGSIVFRAPSSRLYDASRLWDGTLHRPSRLLVLRVMRHLGAEIRMARVLATMSRSSALSITLCAEPRLVALFARSFPEITVRPDTETENLIAAAVCWASYERVAQMVWTSFDAIRRDFVPLLSEAGRRADLRQRYRAQAGGRPIIGISWHSTNIRKRLPELSDWQRFFTSIDCLGLSLQYNPAGAGILHLEDTVRQGIVLDPSVDAFADIDGLAAQIAATDLVVTVSNTTAHLAGALGHPCLVLLDDDEHLSWLNEGERTPFYPSVLLLRQGQRDWSVVMAEVADRAKALLGFPHDTAIGSW